MKIKLNRSKMEGLYQLLSILLKNKASNKAEQILHCIVVKIAIKIRNKLDQYNAKDSYQISLNEYEALAFELWFNSNADWTAWYIYELNVAQAICRDIDKNYGTNFN
jgi:hypothetical protein